MAFRYWRPSGVVYQNPPMLMCSPPPIVDECRLSACRVTRDRAWSKSSTMLSTMLLKCGDLKFNVLPHSNIITYSQNILTSVYKVLCTLHIGCPLSANQLRYPSQRLIFFLIDAKRLIFLPCCCISPPPIAGHCAFATHQRVSETLAERPLHVAVL